MRRNVPAGLEIVAVGPADDPVLVQHYLAIWDRYRTPQEDYVSDAADVGNFAGSVMCCLLRSPYLDVLRPDPRRRGYIGSVYTVPCHRGKGIRRALTCRAVSHLKAWDAAAYCFTHRRLARRLREAGILVSRGDASGTLTFAIGRYSGGWEGLEATRPWEHLPMQVDPKVD